MFCFEAKSAAFAALGRHESLGCWHIHPRYYSSMNSNLQNLLVYQFGWLFTALLVQAGHPRWALGVLMVLFAFHAVTLASRRELRMCAAVALLGYSIDSLFTYYQQIVFVPKAELAPLWLLALWLLFASTFEHCLRFMFTRVWLAALLGAAFGPLTYYLAGRQFSLLYFGAPFYMSFGLYTLAWGLMMGGVAYATRK